MRNRNRRGSRFPRVQRSVIQTRTRRYRNAGNSMPVPKQTALVKGKTVQNVMESNRDVIRIPRLRFMTDWVIVDLTYPDTTFTRNNAGFTYMGWRYRMNSIYDPDPLLGSGSIPGYTAWSAFFNNYRVLQLSYSIDIANLEPSPVDVYVYPSYTDLGSNPITSNEIFGNPHAAQGMIGSKGGMDKTRLKGVIDLGDFTGNTYQYLGNDGYGASFGSNPGNIAFLNVGGVAAATFTTNLGVDTRVTLVYTTLLSGRKTMSS